MQLPKKYAVAMLVGIPLASSMAWYNRMHMPEGYRLPFCFCPWETTPPARVEAGGPDAPSACPMPKV